MIYLIAFASIQLLALIAADARCRDTKIDSYEEGIVLARNALVDGDFVAATDYLRSAFEPDFSEYRADEYRKWLEARAAA